MNDSKFRVVPWLVTTLISLAAFYVGYQTHQTGDALRDIEQSRSAREHRDAEVADFIGTFYARQCHEQMEMERFPLRRWVGIQTPVDRQYVQDACDAFQGDEPTRVIERISIVGRTEGREARVFATLRWANDGRPHNDTGELSYVDLLLEREPRGNAFPYSVRSVAEVRAHAS